MAPAEHLVLPFSTMVEASLDTKAMCVTPPSYHAAADYDDTPHCRTSSLSVVGVSLFLAEALWASVVLVSGLLILIGSGNWVMDRLGYDL